MPLRDDGAHPALFALSCHTNEMGGITDQGLLEQVRAGAATVQTLTELLPPGADDCLRDHARLREVPVLSLSLREVPGGLLDAVCSVVRRAAGRLRSVGAACGGRVSGFVARGGRGVIALGGPPPDSLLALHLGERFEHEDTFELVLHGYRSSGNLATTLLADVLEGFLCNRPGGVSWLMKVRNLVVKPLRLRTSPLGCPASSLLATEGHNLYAGRFPVLDQRVDPRGLRAEVLLGADDRHLRFRSCVGVRFVGDDAHVTLGTRVQCRNRFGRVYMAVIDRVHRAYISPAMLFMAVEHAQRRVQQVEPSTVLAF
jgi:hypothetical protein